MIVEEIFLKGCFVITPKLFKDNRGYFFESYNQKEFEKKLGKDINFVQDNQSQSSKGVLRGLHFQTGDFEQAKLIRAIKGSILDICVDLRKESKTFGKHFSIELNDKENQQLFVPRGFAHGFLVLEDQTIINYKCDNYYNKESESGVIYNDKDLNIDWKYSSDNLIISDKDKLLPTFKSLFKI